jgi:formiminotetrahydrofolate cyclodeaminase
MAARFTDAHDAAGRASALRVQLLAAGDADLRSYQPVLEAMRLPAEDPGRDERLAGALSAASEAPLAVVRAAAEITELAASLAASGNASVRGDAIAGAMLAEAAVRAAARLVEINLDGGGDDPRLAEVAELRKRAARALE